MGFPIKWDTLYDIKVITASISTIITITDSIFIAHLQGIHIGQASALPLPLLPICGESREDIAAQLGMGLEILSAVSGVEVEVLAKQVDTLLTDSTEHNKGVNVILQELYDFEKPAGQIFCGVHTTLGFSSKMNSMVLRIELKMGLDKLLSKFMCSMELDTKNGSLAGQALAMMLRLVAPSSSTGAGTTLARTPTTWSRGVSPSPCSTTRTTGSAVSAGPQQFSCSTMSTSPASSAATPT